MEQQESFAQQIGFAGAVVFALTWLVTGSLKDAAIVGTGHFIAHKVAAADSTTIVSAPPTKRRGL